MEPMFEDIMSGGYKLEEATKDIGSHRTVFQISLQPTMMLKLGKNGSENPQLNQEGRGKMEAAWFTCDKCGYADDTDKRFTYPSEGGLVCIFCKPEGKQEGKKVL